MDNKKNNVKQAMFEMFGVGQDQNEPEKNEKKVIPATPVADAPVVTKKEASAPTSPIAKPKEAASFLAPETSFEGNVSSNGDIEIAGKFKGNIDTKGTVILRAAVEGNLTADNVSIIIANLKGDINATGTVSVSDNSTVTGNVVAKELLCSGYIEGDLTVSDNLILESTSSVNGHIKTGSITVMKGAKIMGGIEISEAKK